jgi:hypothetical protein
MAAPLVHRDRYRGANVGPEEMDMKIDTWMIHEHQKGVADFKHVYKEVAQDGCHDL